MANVTANYPMDLTFQNAWFVDIPATSFTATQVKITYGWNEGYFTGTGFSFPANAAPTGTITGMSFYSLDANSALALYGNVTGLNASFTTFVNTLHPSGGNATQASYTAAMGVLFAGNDTFNGSTGNDVVYGFGGADTMNGGSGNDFADGGAGNDTLSGGDGNDVAEGGAGNDIINGGLGVDTASYSTATAAVAVNLGLAAQQNTLGAGLDTLMSVERLIGSNFNDALTGNTLANLLQGGLGNDALSGGAGNDILEGGAGNDRIAGGAGRDGLAGGAGSDIFIYSVLADSATYATRDMIRDFTTGTVANVGDKIDLRLIDANNALAGDQAFTFVGVSNSFTAAGQVRVANDVIYCNTDANLTTAELVIDLNGHSAGLVAGNFLL